MNKILTNKKLNNFLLIFAMSIFMAGCSYLDYIGDINDIDSINYNADIQDVVYQYSDNNLSVDNEADIILEKFGEIIVEAGVFWDDWLGGGYRFSYEHVSSWDDTPEYMAYLGFRKILPSSGFENLENIKSYLLQFYTESWVDNILNQELPSLAEFNSGELLGLPLFIEYDGELYMYFERLGFPRLKWQTAIHYLLELEDSYVVVKTSVLESPFFHMLPGLTFTNSREEFFRELQELILTGNYVHPTTLSENLVQEAFYHFTFINGKIDNKQRVNLDSFLSFRANLDIIMEWNVFGAY